MQQRSLHTVPWTFRQTLLGICCTLVPYILFTWSMLLFNQDSSPSNDVPFLTDLANAIIVLILSLVVYSAFFLSAPIYLAIKTSPSSDGRKHRILEALGFRTFHWQRTLVLIILLFAAILFLNQIYSWLITYFHLPLQTNDQRVLEQGKHAPLSLYATLFIAVLVAPVCEEVFFRSFVFMGFLRAMSSGVALVLSSLIFALAHNDIGSFAVLFCIGLALAFLRWYSDSIWPNIILHMLNNAAGALVILLTLHGVTF